MSKHFITWECEICKESTIDRLNKVKPKDALYPVHFVCDDCKDIYENFDKIETKGE